VRYEEQRSGDGRGNVENVIVIAGRVADEHVVEHQLGHRRVLGVADVVGAVFTCSGITEHHVVTENVLLHAVVVNDRVQRNV
jgi:hypothetical protein